MAETQVQKRSIWEDDEEPSGRKAIAPKAKPAGLLAPKKGLPPAPIEADLARLAAIEQDIFEKSARVVDSSLQFAETVDASGPPDEWVQKWGQREAELRFRMAQAGAMSSKDAPVAVKMAASVLVGLAKVRASNNRDVTPRTINMQFVQMTQPLPQFEELVVEANK